MKLAVWINAVNAEQDYVKQEPLRKRGPFVADVYADVDEEEEEYGIHRLSIRLSISITL